MRGWIAVIVLLIPAVPAPRAQEAASSDEKVGALFTRHCLECHGTEKPKGDLRLDKLSRDFADLNARERWLAVLEQIQAKSMPPKAKARVPESDARTIADWIGAKVDAADAIRRASQGRVVYRRLNQTEYENTVRDLLGVKVDLKELLPPDSSADGFDNVGKALHVSSFLMERYLEAADKALSVAIVNAPQPPLLKKRFTLHEERSVKVATEKVYRATEDALIMFSSSAWNSIVVGQFYPPDRGKYRIRICASGVQSDGKPVTYRVDAGPMLMGTTNHFVDYFDAQPDTPTVAEFVDELEARNHFRISPYGLETAHTLNKIGAENYKGPGLAVQWVEVEGPLHEIWPPASHRRIFGDLPQAAGPNHRLEVVSTNPAMDAERILRDFTRRAFRRAVTDADVKPFVDLVKAKLDDKQSFEQALRVGLAAVMVAPEFLFLREKPGKLDDFALASRLSYFLWSTMPDAELVMLAEQRTLSGSETLKGQVERMLRDPRSATFTKNFVDQWLGLRDIDFTEPSHILYPEFDDMLKLSMLKETHLYFEELLKNDLSLARFVASDFSMLNGRLARHYGIPGVDGWTFRKVELPADSHRGGLLTMGSVLKVTANGTSTSPVLRGVWVLDRILGTPPPKPPAGVAAVEPDIRGATTMREQLAKHRQIETCAACHARIDPPGFALESFDVIGGWRENYRTSGRGQPVSLNGRKMPYLKGPKVDPSDALADGQRFAGIDEFKQLLLKNKDQIARSLAEKLLTYATGGAPERSDRPEIDSIVRRLQDKDDGLRSLVHEIVQSRMFRTK
jgi:mono/diheme cytochrome c family protein